MRMRNDQWPNKEYHMDVEENFMMNCVKGLE